MIGLNRSRYVRRVSALERYSLVLNQLYRYHVDGILEGRGEVDSEALQDAIDLAAQANPAIRVRLRGALAWSRWVDSGKSPRVRVMSLSDWNGCSELNAPFLQERLEIMRGGPVADVLLVPCTDGMTRIVFRTAHAAIDGRGFMHWVAEVCRAMRGEPLQGSSSTLTDLDIQRQYAGQIPEEPAAPPSNCIPVIPPSPGPHESLSYLWRKVVLNGNVSQLLPKAAAFFAGIARTREQGEVGFTIPVDYRGLRTDEMGIGNLTGYLRLTVPENARPRELMQQLITRIRAKADCRQFPGVKVLLWLPVWYMLRQLKPKVDAILHTVSPALPTGGLVSMGQADPMQYCFPGFQARHLYGIPGAVGKLNVVFLNYPDTTVVSFSAPASYNREGQFDALIERFTQQFSEQESSKGALS